MATNKKSFLLYADLIHTFDKLSDEESGRLVKHLLKYVNDMDPVAPDKLTEIAFEPIKQQLKRDLVRWKELKTKRSEAGKASADKRKQLSTSVKSVEQTSTNPTVNVTVNDTVTVSTKVDDKAPSGKKSSRKSKPFVPPSEKDVINYFTDNGYRADVGAKVYRYYSTADWHDSQGNPVKNWKQKIQGNWFKDENLQPSHASTTTDPLVDHVMNYVNQYGNR